MTRLSPGPAAARETASARELIPLTALVRDVFNERGLRGAVIELNGVVSRYQPVDKTLPAFER